MSMISSICAGHDREIVRKAVEKAKIAAGARFVGDDYVKVRDLLDQVLDECYEWIQE